MVLMVVFVLLQLGRYMRVPESWKL